jgi:hypothetical protein
MIYIYYFLFLLFFNLFIISFFIYTLWNLLMENLHVFYYVLTFYTFNIFLQVTNTIIYFLLICISCYILWIYIILFLEKIIGLLLSMSEQSFFVYILYQIWLFLDIRKSNIILILILIDLVRFILFINLSLYYNFIIQRLNILA